MEETECNYCHELGHIVKTCPVLAKKKAKAMAARVAFGASAYAFTMHVVKEVPRAREVNEVAF